MIQLAPGMLDTEDEGGWLCFQVVGCSDPAAARRGLTSAVEQIMVMPHPEHGPDMSVASAVSFDGDPADLTIGMDIKDIEAYDGLLEQVTDIVVMALFEHGVTDGVLTRPSLR